MEPVEYAKRFLSLLKGPVSLEKHYTIEHCGTINAELDGYSICFPKDKIEDLRELHINSGATGDHFDRTFYVNPEHVISFPAFAKKMTFTEIILEYTGGINEFFDFFGVEREVPVVEDPKDDIVLDIGEESPSSEVVDEEGRGLEEDLIIDDTEDDIEDDISINVETEEGVSGDITNDFVEEEDNEEEGKGLEEDKFSNDDVTQEQLAEKLIASSKDVTPLIPDNISYNNVNNKALPVLQQFHTVAESLPKFKETFEELLFLLHGKKVESEKELVTEEEFTEALQIFNNLNSDEISKIFIKSMKRLWHDGEVLAVSKFIREVVYRYLEEMEE